MMLLLDKKDVKVVSELILDKIEECAEREEIAKYSILFAKIHEEIAKEEEAEKARAEEAAKKDAGPEVFLPKKGAVKKGE